MDALTAAERAVPWIDRPDVPLRMQDGSMLDLSTRPLVMGIVNVTPDSFSDGGRYYDHDAAVDRARKLIRTGADIIDIGGESTRPGSEPVPAPEEKRRVLPVIEALSDQDDAPISIDTRKSEVAEAAIDAGADIVNDVSALKHDPEMGALVADREVPVCLMHMQGTPENMQDNPTYDEVVTDVRDWLSRRLDAALEAGIDEDRTLVDPGFGFGKTVQHNLELMHRLHEFHALGRPLLVGTSRKSMIGAVLGVGTDDRLNGTLATVTCAAMSGAHIMRVHDAGPAREALAVCEAIRRGREWTSEDN